VKALLCFSFKPSNDGHHDEAERYNSIYMVQQDTYYTSKTIVQKQLIKYPTKAVHEDIYSMPFDALV
jgi:hypothetical protein